MKRIGVAGYITRFSNDLLLGRRGKDPNRGLYVLPGGGVEDGETLEHAFRREILEETGYEVLFDPDRWKRPLHVIELDDRLVIVAEGFAMNHNDQPQANSDLYDVEWFSRSHIPYKELSPAVQTVLHSIARNKEAWVHYNPFSNW